MVTIPACRVLRSRSDEVFAARRRGERRGRRGSVQRCRGRRVHACKAIVDAGQAEVVEGAKGGVGEVGCGSARSRETRGTISGRRYLAQADSEGNKGTTTLCNGIGTALTACNQATELQPMPSTEHQRHRLTCRNTQESRTTPKAASDGAVQLERIGRLRNVWSDDRGAVLARHGCELCGRGLCCGHWWSLRGGKRMAREGRKSSVCVGNCPDVGNTRSG